MTKTCDTCIYWRKISWTCPKQTKDETVKGDDKACDDYKPKGWREQICLKTK